MILVTGGTGLVGSHLLYYLSLKHDKLRATYRRKEKINLVKHVFSYYSENANTLFNKIEWVETDLNNVPKLSDAFAGVDYVYHCAAKVSFDPNQYRKLRKVNIEGAANIVNLCISNHVKKLCYVSSVAAVGDSEKNKFANEASPWNNEADHSIYAITKYGGEMEVWRGSQEGVDVVIVNPGIIIGPGFWRTSSGSLIRRIDKGLKYYTTADSGYIDIHDVVKPMIMLMESDVKNEGFILVSDHISFKTFAEDVSKALGVKPPIKKASNFMLQFVWRLDWLGNKLFGKRRKLTKHMVRSITTNNYFSSEKIKKTLDYKFKSIDDSIAETCRLYLSDRS